MAISKKNIVDDIEIILTRFNKTDDSRLDEDWMSYTIDKVRSQLIRAEYKITNVLDSTWMSDLGTTEFYAVNFADDRNITCCECDISKAELPAIVSLESGNGNQDLGLTIMSMCGTKKYYPLSLSLWSIIPSEHPRNLYPYFSRIGTATYVNRKGSQLRPYAVLQNPEDAYIKNTAPVVSGTIATGIVYLVKNAQIVYNSTVYAPNTTFTGVIGVTTFTGSGTVYLNTQATAFNDTDAYPVTNDMARQIVIEICTKEFGIERMGIAADDKNDSKDDKLKA